MITKEQFGEWRQHPATKFFLTFLTDRKNDITAMSMDHFLHGAPSFEANRNVYRGQILQLLELEQITFEAIETFYKEKDDGNESISEGS